MFWTRKGWFSSWCHEARALERSGGVQVLEDVFEDADPFKRVDKQRKDSALALKRGMWRTRSCSALSEIRVVSHWKVLLVCGRMEQES